MAAMVSRVKAVGMRSPLCIQFRVQPAAFSIFRQGVVTEGTVAAVAPEELVEEGAMVVGVETALPATVFPVGPAVVVMVAAPVTVVGVAEVVMAVMAGTGETVRA
ncbi:MAG: hypothetical protein WAU45_02565 [Blastocatellia bacterium]